MAVACCCCISCNCMCPWNTVCPWNTHFCPRKCFNRPMLSCEQHLVFFCFFFCRYHRPKLGQSLVTKNTMKEQGYKIQIIWVHLGVFWKEKKILNCLNLSFCKSLQSPCVSVALCFGRLACSVAPQISASSIELFFSLLPWSGVQVSDGRVPERTARAAHLPTVHLREHGQQGPARLPRHRGCEPGVAHLQPGWYNWGNNRDGWTFVSVRRHFWEKHRKQLCNYGFHLKQPDRDPDRGHNALA